MAREVNPLDVSSWFGDDAMIFVTEGAASGGDARRRSASPGAGAGAARSESGPQGRERGAAAKARGGRQ